VNDKQPPDWNGLNVHFIAVGGIGMSALARIAAARGAAVDGCDRVESPELDRLRAQGVRCTVGHSPAHVENADLVIYSSAVPRENPELRAAIDRGARVVSRGRALAWLQEEADTVAVSGSHGKTTTTWITANLLLRCGLDPTVVVGGQVSELNGNVRIGRSRLFVTEADESDGSFLHLRPQYGVVTNIDADHLDHWASIGELEADLEGVEWKGMA
jgi:UDP-N-acetylmuramate--alanine ligase